MSLKLYIDMRGQDLSELYEDWTWLISKDTIRNPLAMNSFGDLFYLNNDGTVGFLDTAAGVIGQVADTMEDFQLLLTKAKRQGVLFYSSLVELLEADMMLREAEQIYSFRVPLHLGGQLTVDNVEIIDQSVALSILGQIQEQTKDLAVGTKINGIGIKQDVFNRLS